MRQLSGSGQAAARRRPSSWRWALLGALLLAACQEAGPPPPPEPHDREAPTFSLRLEPALLDLTIDEQVVVQVELTRSGGFSDTVRLRPDPAQTLPAGLQMGNLDLEGAASSGQITISADQRLAPGSYYINLQATADEQVKGLLLGIHLRAPLARVDHIAVEDAGDSRQARQGQGAVVLVLQGQHFDRIQSFDLEDLPVTVADGRSDAQVRLLLDVGHGTAVGPRALTTTTTGYGASVLPEALVVSFLTSSPDGDDASGRGTPDLPFRTLSRALGEAATGDTVWLQDGLYDEAAGETWPQQTWFATEPPDAWPQANVPAGVEIRGQSRDGVVLAGSYMAGATSLGLVFEGQGLASRLTLRDFATAVFAAFGEQSLSEVDLFENSEGLLVVGEAQTRYGDAIVQATLHDGVRVGNDARLQLSNVMLDGNLWGLSASGAARVELLDSWVSSSQLYGLRFFDATSVLIEGSNVQGSQLAGILFRGHDLSLRGSVLQGNGDSGLRVEGDPQLVDLGGLLDVGGNELSGNLPYQLHDAREGRDDLLGVEITLSATSLQGVTPEPDVVVGPVAEGDLYFIEGTNQRMQFY